MSRVRLRWRGNSCHDSTAVRAIVVLGCDMAKLLMTIQSPGGAPSLEELKARYGLAEHEIDSTFGVVPIDPADHLYSISVEDTAAAKIQPDKNWKVSGPYSNPIIQPFGPPR